MLGGVKSCGGGGSCIGGYLLCLWVNIEWVCGGDHGRGRRSVMGFFEGMVQVVGFVWRGSGGLWCEDCCLVWWKSTWNYGGYGKSTWIYVCGSVVGFDGGSISGFLFLFLFWVCWYMWGVLVWFDLMVCFFFFLTWFWFWFDSLVGGARNMRVAVVMVVWW